MNQNITNPPKQHRLRKKIGMDLVYGSQNISHPPKTITHLGRIRYRRQVGRAWYLKHGNNNEELGTGSKLGVRGT